MQFIQGNNCHQTYFTTLDDQVHVRFCEEQGVKSILLTRLCIRQSQRSPELIFARKMYLCVQLLGDRSDILSVIGSWRDSLSDDHVFEALDSWIDDTVKEQSDSLDYIKEWHNK